MLPLPEIFQFWSDSNQAQFEAELELREVLFMRAGRFGAAVTVESSEAWVSELAREYGASRCQGQELES
jgi:hypothetical protein